jgi:predicted HTH domain antitoxin
MQITVQLPDDLSQHPNPGREALETLAIEGYRSGALSHYQSAQLLGLSRMEFDGVLKERAVMEHGYDVQDLDDDLKAADELRAKGLLKA